VSGGTVSATSENAIIARGLYAMVFVSGGVVSNNATSNYAVIYMVNKNNTILNIMLGSTGKIEAKGKGYAIATSGWMDIRDSAQVIANEDAAIYDCNRLILCDMCKVISRKKFAIGSSAKDMDIVITGKAQVIANASHAINLPNNQGSVDVTGGLVFAHNSDINSVILSQNFIGPTENSVILAWDKAAGNTTYEIRTTTDIYTLPKSVTAFWNKNGEENGISYYNGSHTGFIPIDVTLTEGEGISENALCNILVYPNPTTGELIIDNEQLIMNNEQLIMNNVEVFDVYGRKQISYLKSHISNLIDISHLAKGVYFLKVGNRIGKVVKL